MRIPLHVCFPNPASKNLCLFLMWFENISPQKSPLQKSEVESYESAIRRILEGFGWGVLLVAHLNLTEFGRMIQRWCKRYATGLDTCHVNNNVPAQGKLHVSMLTLQA